MFAAIRQRTITSLWPSYTSNIQMRKLSKGEGQEERAAKDHFYQLNLVFCNHFLHCFLLVRAPESPLMADWLSKYQHQEISTDQIMITVRQLGSEGDEGEVRVIRVKRG